MNKLLALSIALLSLNLYGQKLKGKIELISDKGLEGWGKGGVQIMVMDYSDKAKDFDVKAIKNQVELKLRIAGIEIVPRSVYKIGINCVPVRVDREGKTVITYYTDIDIMRVVGFLNEANGEVYSKEMCIVYDYGGSCGALKLRGAIDQWMDQFLLDYLKANPKKKEK